MSNLLKCKVCNGKVLYFSNIPKVYSTISFYNSLYKCEACNFVFSPSEFNQKLWYKNYLPEEEIESYDSFDKFIFKIILNELSSIEIKLPGAF